MSESESKITIKDIKTYWNKEKTKLKEEYYVNNGKKDGIYKKYNYQGKLSFEVSYISGKMNGIYKSYKNGNLSYEVNYRDDVLHGTHIDYNENGNIIEIKYYENGVEITKN
jgi:antitoxin component YwqK of YwqJK toxin-antitoxin module